MGYSYHFAVSRNLFSLLRWWWLWYFHSVITCHGQVACPSACECLRLSADCRGDNVTLAQVVHDLPTELESFRFIVKAPSSHKTVAINLNSVQGIDKFKNLRSFQIQPYYPLALVNFEVTNQQRNVFCNWTLLEEIHLNLRATYSNITVESFNCLQQLKVLDLSYSEMITDSVFQHLLSINLSRHITTLLLRNIQTLGIDETVEIYFSRLVSNLNTSSLEVIDLSANAIRVCHPGLLLIPNLKKLDLSQNLLFIWTTNFRDTRLTVYEALLHPSMQEFHASDFGIFIPTNGEEYRDWFHKLLSNCSQISTSLVNLAGSELWLQLCSSLRKSAESIDSSSQCLFGMTIPVGRHLELLNISTSTKYSYPYVNHLPQGRFCLDPNNVISTIDISNMNAAQIFDNPTLSNLSITGLSRIKYFNGANNGSPLSNFQVFDTMPTLEQLLLGGNKIQIHMDIDNELFASLGDLRDLDLSQNELHVVPHAEFAHLAKLERLDLSDNRLSDLDIQLPNSSSLKLLNLSSNGMTYLRESMAHQFDNYPHLEVDLLGNEFICNCKALWFIGWVQTTSTRLTGKNVLNCYTEEGQQTIIKINLKHFSKHCHPMSLLEVSLISTSAALCFIFLVGILIVLYRQRWRIRHYWYRRRLRQERAALNDDYEYDAYVSYSDCSPEVRRWVSGVMHEELECKRGLKLFLHQRDLLGGGLILERIDAAMRKCRKTILVLSPEFLQSRTCLYEAWSAHTSMVTEDRDAVVLVKMQALPLAGITGTLASLMQVRECLDWTEDPIGQDLFWERLEDTVLSILDNPIID